MEIREYQEKDKQPIIELMREFGAYLESLDPMERTEFAPGGAEYFTEKLVKDTGQKQGRIYVAEEAGKVVGFIGGYIEEQSEEELMEDKKAVPGVVSEFFVTQTVRRRGIGSALIEKLETYLKEQGGTLIRLDVFAPNQIGREFYRKHGYRDRSVIVSKDL